MGAGVDGTMEYVSDLMRKLKGKRKKKQIYTTALKVRMDCEGCEKKMKNVLSHVKGVKQIETNWKEQRVTVTGYMDAKKLLEAAKTTKKKCEPWPYIPIGISAHPYISAAYDKKAPPNFVRGVGDTSGVKETMLDHNLTTMFSDDDPNNACSIM